MLTNTISFLTIFVHFFFFCATCALTCWQRARPHKQGPWPAHNCTRLEEGRLTQPNVTDPKRASEAHTRHDMLCITNAWQVWARLASPTDPLSIHVMGWWWTQHTRWPNSACPRFELRLRLCELPFERTHTCWWMSFGDE